jgi:hypothetical protein
MPLARRMLPEIAAVDADGRAKRACVRAAGSVRECAMRPKFSMHAPVACMVACGARRAFLSRNIWILPFVCDLPIRFPASRSPGPGRSITLELMHCTVPLCNGKLCTSINRSGPILVLTTVLDDPRRADVKKDVKNYHGPTTSRENAIRKYQNFYPSVFLNFNGIMT